LLSDATQVPATPLIKHWIGASTVPTQQPLPAKIAPQATLGEKVPPQLSFDATQVPASPLIEH
jgi:hypothetical protein